MGERGCISNHGFVFTMSFFFAFRPLTSGRVPIPLPTCPAARAGLVSRMQQGKVSARVWVASLRAQLCDEWPGGSAEAQ